MTGCALTGAAAVVAGLTNSFSLLLLARTVQGVGSALYVTAAMGLVVAVAPHAHAARVVALYQGTFMIGLAVGPMIGGLVGGIFGLRGPFFAYAAMALAGLALAAVRLPSKEGYLALLAAQFRESPASDRRGRRHLLRQLLTGRAFLLTLFVILTIFWVRAGVRSTLLPLFAQHDVGLGASTIGALLTVVGLGNIAVVWHSGQLLDRYGRRPVIIGSLLATSASIAVFAGLGQAWALYIAALFFGAAMGYSAVAPTAVLVDVADPRIRGTAVGIQRMATDFGLLLGPVGLGALMDVMSFRAVFVVSALLVLAAAVVALAIPETSRRGSEQAEPAAASEL